MTKKEKNTLMALESYVESCNVGGKGAKRIPNLCGLCRYMGIGKREMMSILSGSEELADRIFTVLEDEAVNSGATGTAYTQQLHNLSEFRAEVFGDENAGEGITAIFGHPDGEEG